MIEGVKKFKKFKKMLDLEEYLAGWHTSDLLPEKYPIKIGKISLYEFIRRIA